MSQTELKGSAQQALAEIVELLRSGFTGEISLRCKDGGVADWKVTTKHHPRPKA